MDVISVHLSADERRIVWAIPRGEIVVRRNGPRWNLDAETTDPASLSWRWDDAVDSLRRWLAEYQPPIVYEHEHLNRRPGEPVPAHGFVTGMFTMTADEASEVGVDLRGAPEAAFLVLEPDAETLELLDAGALPYTSPALEGAYEDDTGEVWPLVLIHHSFVRNPRQKRRQVPSHDLRGLSDTAYASRAARLSEGESPCTYGVIMQDNEEKDAPMADAPEGGGGDALAELAEMVRSLAERLDRIESAAMADAPAEDDNAAAMSDDATEVDKLRSDLAAMRAELARRDAAEEVRAVMSEREAPAEAADLLTDLRIELGEARFKSVVGLMPKRVTPKTSRAAAPAGSISAALGDLDVASMTVGQVAHALRERDGFAHDYSHYVPEARAIKGAI